MKIIFLSIILALVLSNHSLSQTVDSLLSYEQYLQLVIQNHPIAKQIALKRTKAELTLKSAKAGFDPQLNAQWDTKQFDEKNYYNILQTHLNIPIWNGIGAEMGYNYTAGYYLNPENKLPSNGQAFLGIKASLLKGLWTDERRTAIDKAKVMVNASEAEINLALNDLLYQAAIAYWEWSQAYHQWQISVQSLSLIQEQLAISRQLYLQGELPAIDTLKSFVKLQQRQIYNSEQTLQVQQASQQLSIFLWTDATEPLEIDYLQKRPSRLIDMPTPLLADQFLDNSIQQLQDHPWLQYYQFKLSTLSIEQKLKQNKLLPKLDIKYNFLATNDVDFFGGNAATPIENYKFGVKFSMPLFLRKERMELRLNKLKQQETNYQQQAKRQELTVKIKNYFTATQTYAQQARMMQKMVNNYQQLLEGEQIKFTNGESSLFLINTRESQLFDSQQKLIKQQIYYFKSKTKLAWISANLSN